MSFIKKYLVRLLKGDFSQNEAFWLILLPSLLTIKFAYSMLSIVNILDNPVLSTRLWLPVIFIVILLIPLIFLSTFSAIYISTTKFRGGMNSFLLFSATLFVLFLTIRTSASHIDYISNMLKIALKQDDYGLVVSVNDSNNLELSGSLEYGASKVVSEILKSNESIQVVNLNLDGGHLHEARDIARLIYTNGLDTSVESKCLETCMLLLTAGKVRTVFNGAELGFHRLKGYDNGYRSDWVIEMERKADQHYYRLRGVRESFLHPIFYKQEDNGYFAPTLDVLLANGVINRVI